MSARERKGGGGGVQAGAGVSTVCSGDSKVAPACWKSPSTIILSETYHCFLEEGSFSCPDP